MFEVGQKWRRVKAPQPSGGYHPTEKVGDVIYIEEAPLPQTAHGARIDHARAVYLVGSREGEKIQVAISYIEADFQEVNP